MLVKLNLHLTLNEIMIPCVNNIFELLLNKSLCYRIWRFGKAGPNQEAAHLLYPLLPEKTPDLQKSLPCMHKRS